MYFENSTLLESLRRSLDYYIQLGMTARLIEPTHGEDYTALIIALQEVGRKKREMQLEISYIPGLAEAAAEGVYLLQAFIELLPAVPAEHRGALQERIGPINAMLALGAFGVIPETGALYLKHNSVLHRSWLEDPQFAHKLDKQCGLLVHQLYLYTDELTDWID